MYKCLFKHVFAAYKDLYTYLMCCVFHCCASILGRLTWRAAGGMTELPRLRLGEYTPQLRKFAHSTIYSPSVHRFT